MSTEVKLNLTRKWRSKNFDQIIGQELSVRMLKNSLYLNHFFPVYLFSGQRGCGKTSTARVFAAALNCEQLPGFQNDPKSVTLPCLECRSCKAMVEGKHPDFIEIDAASHTGVDNVRQIIDACSLLPALARKRVYLIDEAHMLSKAAFNAFLKILEEPPSSVLFILATTDPQKIIDTVTSRCFRLFFKPVERQTLVDHLHYICQQEKIRFEPMALQLIVKESQGSARDALNLLEQVRFSSHMVSVGTVQSVLGHSPDDSIIELFSHILAGNAKKVCSYLQDSQFSQYNPDFIFRRFIVLLRELIHLSYDVELTEFSEHYGRLTQLLGSCTVLNLTHFLEQLYNHEPLFIKTIDKFSFLEMILLQMAQSQEDNGNSSMPAQASPVSDQNDTSDSEDGWEYEEGDDLEDEYEEEIDEDYSHFKTWNAFIQQIQLLQDPLLTSIFTQGQFLGYWPKTGECKVRFSSDFTFFSDWLEGAKEQWRTPLQKVFGDHVHFIPQFDGKPAEKKEREPVKLATPAPQERPQPANQPKKQFHQKKRSSSFNLSYKGRAIDVSDQAMWQKTNMILRYFPGKVEMIAENQL